MHKYASPSAAKLLVGNKTELTDKRVVEYTTGKASKITNLLYTMIAVSTKGWGYKAAAKLYFMDIPILISHL